MEERNLYQLFIEDLKALEPPENYKDDIYNIILDATSELEEIEERLLEERHKEIKSMNASFEKELL